MSRPRSTSFLLLVAAIITSVVNGGHSQVPLNLSLRLRVFDPKYDTAEHGKGITLSNTIEFRHGDPFRLVSGGNSELPGFEERLEFGTIIDGDTRVQNDRTVMVNLKLMMSARFSPDKQQDVHQVEGKLLQVCCPVTLGKVRKIQCSDGRLLEILLDRQK